MNPEVDTRYFKQLLAARGISLRQLAERMNMTHSQLSLTFSGKRRMQLDEAATLAQFFGVTLQDIAAATGVELATKADRFCPVTAFVGEDGAIAPLSEREQIRIPADLPDTVEAIQVRSPRSWLDGWWLFYEAADSVRPEAIGQTSLCVATNGQRLLGVVGRGYHQHCYRIVTQLGVVEMKLLSATPILMAKQ